MEEDDKLAQAMEFLDSMETRHNHVLDELDRLNDQIEQVLDEYQKSIQPPATPQIKLAEESQVEPAKAGASEVDEDASQVVAQVPDQDEPDQDTPEPVVEENADSNSGAIDPEMNATVVAFLPPTEPQDDASDADEVSDEDPIQRDAQSERPDDDPAAEAA